MDVYSVLYWNILQFLVKLCEQIPVKYSKTAYLCDPHDDLKMLCYGTKTKAHDDCHRLRQSLRMRVLFKLAVVVVVVKSEHLYYSVSSSYIKYWNLI